MQKEDDDARHRREEQERRAKRKASKIAKTDAQREKERKRKEHQQKILNKHGGAGAAASKKPRTGEDGVKSAFSELFSQRTSGFQIDFSFRNAPPRPPVGPTFVGHALEDVLREDLSRTYKPLNSVEVNYTWRLHSEADLGVPLAPSAMDLKSYKPATDDEKLALHPADAALLDWTGSLGDTAAEDLKRRRERAAAGLRSPLPSPAPAQQPRTKKPQFSRVLNEGMQTWMKKTTYLSNDYSKKVHDFKSLAQTKKELEEGLQAQQVEISKRRTAVAIAKSFDLSTLQHPTNKTLRPKHVFSVLPNADHWGLPYTHLVIDKRPNVENLHAWNQAIVAHVEKRQANARMTCQLFVPSDKKDDNDDNNDSDEAVQSYEAAQSYDLDVFPLKEEDVPATHYCLWLDRSKLVATYLPISSRVALATGRPLPNGGFRKIRRRPLTNTEREEVEERMAEVDQDLAEKHHLSTMQRSSSPSNKATHRNGPVASGGAAEAQDDDGADESVDDEDSSANSSGDENLFGAGTQTIVAEN